MLLYAVLEHCTPAECLETIRTSWDLLRPGGYLLVIEPPNRFGYMDVHTTFLPFFHLLPGPIALRYYHRTQRQRVITTLDDAARCSNQEAELARDVPAPIGFARFVLNMILRKPTGALPTEPLVPLASRTEFLINYADVKVDSPVQRARLLQEFEHLGKTEWVISGNDADLLVPTNQVSITPEVDFLRLQADGYDPYLYLPPLDAPLPRAIMRIDIDASGHSILQVFYTTSEQCDYAEERSIRVPIYRGRNLLLVELPAGVAGRLRLDPGEIPGEYRIYWIELRW